MVKRVTSYADQLERDRLAKVESQITGDDPMAEIEVALDARELGLAMRKQVVRKLAERIAADEIGSGDLVRLLGMINDRVDGKVVDKVEHSGSIGIAQVLESVMGKTAGLPNPAWYDVVDKADVLGHNRVVLDAEVVSSDNIGSIISE
jgi:hypothetical protein